MQLFGKIFLPIFVSLLVASGVIGYVTYSNTVKLVDDGIDREISLRTESQRNLANEKLSKIVQASEIIAKQHKEQAAVVSSLDFVKGAYTEAHRGNIDQEDDQQVTNARNHLKDSFSSIEDSFISLTGHADMRAHFHLSNGRSFARVWRDGWQVTRDGKKLDISDDLSSFRQMVVDINANKKPLAGLELGIGGFVIRGIVPVFDLDSNPAGSVESYSSFGLLVKETELPRDMNISLVMPSDKLGIAKRLNDTTKYPLIGNKWVEVYSSDSAILPEVYNAEEFSNAFSQTSYSYEIPSHGIFTRIVKDYNGKSIGLLVLTADLSAWNATISKVRDEGHKQSRNALIYTTGLLALVLLLLGSIAYVIAHRVSRLALSAAVMLEDMECGNLDSRLDVKGNDELARLNVSLNKFADNLRDEVLAAFEKLAEGDLTFEAKGVIKEPLMRANHSLSEVMQKIQLTGAHIATSSLDASNSSNILAQGATEQASSLEEISASIEELSSQTSLNAENANKASSLTAKASQTATSGNQQMREMVSAMEEINDASGNISKIIKVIDEIAFQTNLLALNAAVEAARAGQHGKGFAVVAEEVRNLAARSAKAAHETASLIEGSVEKTVSGAAIANKTADSLQDIVDGISAVSDLVAEISTASNEQAQGLSQINEGITQLDMVTQRNASSAETSATVSEELSSQSEQMRQMLQRFVIKNDAESSAATTMSGSSPQKSLGSTSQG